jgi:hypothetical protein
MASASNIGWCEEIRQDRQTIIRDGVAPRTIHRGLRAAATTAGGRTPLASTAADHPIDGHRSFDR